MKNKENKTYSVLEIDRNSEEYMEEAQKYDKSIKGDIIALASSIVPLIMTNHVASEILNNVGTDNLTILQFLLVLGVRVAALPLVMLMVKNMIADTKSQSKLTTMAGLAKLKEEMKEKENTRSR